jgi:saccharopine dehydrogenase-like NADP-dependent oxidoreductase
MKDKILVVGGYGQVGKYVTLKLLEIFPNKIIVAGRSLEKAIDFANEHNNAFEILQLDIYDANNFEDALKNINIVVMCLTPKNIAFAEYCIKHGIHYIDISPFDNVLKTIKDFSKEAADNHSTCVLGVGIAPGLSNLLVKKLHAQFDTLRDVKISLLLGVGEHHGEDGVKWLLDNINQNFTLKINDTEKSFSPFIQKNKTTFMNPLGKRSAYRFNLADQFIVIQTLHVDNASSYFSYDSKFITTYISVLKRIGIFRLLKFKIMYRIMLKIFVAVLSLIRKLKMGTDIYGIQIDVTGIKDGKTFPCSIGTIGNNNSLLTGHIAAFVAAKLASGKYSSGVFYLEELFSLDDINNFGINPRIEMSVSK